MCLDSLEYCPKATFALTFLKIFLGLGKEYILYFYVPHLTENIFGRNSACIGVLTLFSCFLSIFNFTIDLIV